MKHDFRIKRGNVVHRCGSETPIPPLPPLPPLRYAPVGAPPQGGALRSTAKVDRPALRRSKRITKSSALLCVLRIMGYASHRYSLVPQKMSAIFVRSSSTSSHTKYIHMTRVPQQKSIGPLSDAMNASRSPWSAYSDDGLQYIRTRLQAIATRRDREKQPQFFYTPRPHLVTQKTFQTRVPQGKSIRPLCDAPNASRSPCSANGLPTGTCT